MAENTEFKDFRDEVEILTEMNDLNNDFKIFHDKNENKTYIITLHFRIMILKELIKKDNNLFAVIKSDNSEETLYLKQTIDEWDVDYIENCKTLCVSDSFNFFKVGKKLKTISFPNNNKDFKLEVTTDFRDSFK